ncbi:MAG TPA: transglycosylase domain-containing protein [Candidatus Solibacter sp.]|nr:transglycosylase domain-containing protein [Candidatus Solibacter sp.]
MSDTFEELRSPPGGGAVTREGPSTTRRQPNVRRRRRGPALVPAGWSVRLLMSAVLVAAVCATALFAYAKVVLADLPSPSQPPVLARSIVVYDRNGKVLAERNQQGVYHVVLSLDQMGKNAITATLAAEDRDFYNHGALDIPGIVRAIIADTLAGRPVQGGSTISQQLVKIDLNASQKSLTRKIREALVANALEKRYSKDQILEMYLNRVYYGHGAYGIGAATKTYFGSGKNASDLTPAQAALLAGMIQAPNGNDPLAHFDRARSRQLDVLHSMQNAGMLTAEQAAAAAKEDIRSELKFDTSYRATKAPHFVDYIVSRLEQMYGAAAAEQGGYSVYTTIDPDMQARAEHSVAVGVQSMAHEGVNNGMLLAARADTGEILAWVGSADFNNAAIGGQFDVIRSPRQPGSSFKPYVYEAALKSHKITLSSCVSDEPTDFNGYQPLDFDNSYMGRMTAQQALVLSRNIPAVEVAQAEGINNVISLAQQMGITSTLQPYLSTAIGGSEVTMFDHVQGYQVFANQGHKVPLMSITKITDPTGQALFEQKPGKQSGQLQVLSAAEAYLMTDTLKAYQNQWNLGWKQQMASKSGTSGASQIGVHQDAWMMAYNSNIVVGGWTGNTGANGAGNPISAFGVTTGSTMLADFINGLPAGYNQWYQQPSGLVSRGGELYLPGTENLNNSCLGAGGGGGGEGHGHKHGDQPPPILPPQQGDNG